MDLVPRQKAKNNRRGKAKYENIIKIIYFPAAIVVFPLTRTRRVFVLDILISAGIPKTASAAVGQKFASPAFKTVKKLMKF